MAILSTPLQYLTSIPLATQIIATLLVVSPIAHAYLGRTYTTTEPMLVILPGAILWRPWTLVTAIFVEVDPISWIFGFLFMVLSFRYLERLWGAVEVFKFILITGVISNVIACAVNWLEYMVLGMPDVLLFGQTYYGTTAVTTGILVAFTQLIPEHQVQLFGILRIRVKRLPMIYVTISTILCLVGYQAPWIIIQFGWLVSWTYLRFYKKSGSESGTETYGDRSETFAFVYWFPPFLHVPLGIVFNTAYNGAVKIGLVRPFSSSPSDLESGALPGGARAEAERRRAMALKALDQRVQKANAAQGQDAPASSSSSDAGTKADEAAAPADTKGKGKAPVTAES